MDARGAIGARVVGMDLPDLRHRPLFLDGSFGAGVCSGPVLVAAGAGDAEDPAVRFTPNAPLGSRGEITGRTRVRSGRIPFASRPDRHVGSPRPRR